MEMMDGGIRIVDGETFVNSNGRVVSDAKKRGAPTLERINKKRKRGMTYINDEDGEVVIENRCGEGKLCCIQHVGEDVEVEQSIAKHKVETIVEEILDEIISVAEKRVKKKRGGVPCGKGHCHKKFDNRSNMERHLEAETEIYCEHCNKGFMGKRNLRTHMERSHEKFLKKPRCEMCDRVFPSEKLLNNHKKQHDSNYAKFECDVCMIYLSQKFSVQRHKKAIYKEVILLEKENLREVNTFLKDNTPVISKGEIMEECGGDGEAFDLFKKMVNIE